MESIESASSLSSTIVEEVHARKILQELWRQCKSEEFCDVVLIAGTEEKRIPAHSNILSAASKYFKGMLPPSAGKSTTEEVKLSTVDGDVLQSLVKYCYTGRITISGDIAVKLLENANVPILSDVFPACANFLINHLLPSNCLRVMLLAQKYHCEQLLQKARDYSLENYMEVQKTDDFLKLNAIQLGELLACDNLNVYSEEHVFNSLMAWRRHDPIVREKYLAELLKLVRLPLLKKSFLMEDVKVVCTSTECREIYIEALEQHVSPLNVKTSERLSIKFRKSKQILMGITFHKRDQIFIHYHCPQRLKWMKWPKLLKHRESFGVAVMEDNLFFVGGYQLFYGQLNTVVCLSLKTMNLKKVAPMIEGRRGCGAVVLNGFLYAVGGDITNDYRSAEKWNPKTNTWSKVASMVVGRSGFGIAVLNEKLYAVGGYSSNGLTSSAECYDPQQNVWMSIASMQEVRSNFVVAVCNGLLYAVGGDGAIKTVERYIPKFNSWTMIYSLDDHYRSCTTFRDKVIVCYWNRIEEYNEETNEWKTSASLTSLPGFQVIFTYSNELLTSEFVEN